MSKIVRKSIESRFLKSIFNCSQKELNKITGIVASYEEQYNVDVIDKLLDMISQRDDEFSLNLKYSQFRSLVNFVICEFFYSYFMERGIPKESDFYELLIESFYLFPDATHIKLKTPFGIEDDLLEFGISPEQWKHFRKTLDLLIKS
ncbi:MAG: hypothetical protein ACFFG0_05050 [Candidatus Thorarchaeota archaeon]